MLTVRASKLNQARTCPGSLRMPASAVGTTEYLEVGHVGHRYLEHLLGGVSPCVDPEQVLVAGIEQDKITAEQAAEFREIGEWAADLIPEDATEIATEVEAELRLDAEHAITGHIDHLAKRPGDLIQVIDWKFYNDPDRLPPISDDLQMLAYAAMFAEHAGGVRVRRVACYFRRYDELWLEPAHLTLLREGLLEVLTEIEGHGEELRSGAHCPWCSGRAECPAYERMGRAVSQSEMVPWAGHALVSQEQALALLLALPVVTDRLQQARALLEAYVRASGPIVDPISKRAWGPHEQQRDRIDDAGAVLADLARLIGSEAALSAASTTKGALEGVLKLAKLPPDSRRKFMQHQRDEGRVIKTPSPRWEWKKV